MSENKAGVNEDAARKKREDLEEARRAAVRKVPSLEFRDKLRRQNEAAKRQ